MTDNLLPSTIRAIVARFPAVVPHLSETAIDFIKAAGYDGIRTVMRGAVFGSVFGYLSGDGAVTGFRERMITAVSRAYIETVDIAYVEGGGELPIDEETATWAREQLDMQIAFIEQLFNDLRELRRSEEFDAGAVANARADGYASAMDGYYGEAKMRGGKNVTLEFGGSDGKENCSTCARLKGKKHKVSYILEHNLIPRPGNESFECLCYNCDHFWFNPKTGEKYAV